MRKTALTLLCLSATSIGFGQAVTNGGFESFIGNDVPIYQGQTVSDWTVTASNNRAAVVSNTYTGGSGLPNTPFGTKQLYVDANGMDTTITSQVTGISANTSYFFSFYMTDFVGSDGRVSASVLDSSSNALGGNLFVTPVGSGWLKHTFLVDVASDTNLKFLFKSVPGSFGAVDNIQVIAAPVPEPATMAALGLGVVGLVRRKRKSSVQN